VIPVGPNDLAWKWLLPSLLAQKAEFEIIMSACQPQPVDSLLADKRIFWLVGEPGRARQLNRGAERAGGQFLWFLHADSEVTPAVWAELTAFIAQDCEALGYFQLGFANDGPLLTRLNARLANWRSAWLGLPFGDQGFVLKKNRFDRLGGFDEWVSLGEDLDFVVRARAMGMHLQGLDAVLRSSARRYQQYGWLTTSLRHIYLTGQLTWQAQRRLKRK
jgi:hypothetical protein